MKTVISTSKAPAAIGPYSQAIRKGDTLYLSGHVLALNVFENARKSEIIF